MKKQNIPIKKKKHSNIFKKKCRRRYNSKRVAITILSVCAILGIGTGGWWLWTSIDNPLATFTNKLQIEKVEHTPEPTPVPTPTPEPVATVPLMPENISSNYALLIQKEDGKVIWSKGNPSDKVWPASITKVLTALVALERITDLNQTFSMPLVIYQPLLDQNASMAGFWAGESPTMQDLLYGTILPSGAEAATALAIAVAGSEEAFLQLMNEKAAQLGMKNSNFTNVWGIYQENHYSTPEDLALLMQAALQNEVLTTILSTPTYTTAPLSAHPEGVSMKHSVLTKPELFQNTDFLLKGGKTGFTDEAGLCLASFAEKNGKEFILITTGAMVTLANMQPLHITDAVQIYQSIVWQ